MGPASTFWTGLGAIRRNAFLELGGFDETVSWIRDIELGMRLRGNGGSILLDPSIQGKHLKRWTVASMVETDIFRRGVPWLRLVLEGRADPTSLNLSWRHRIGTGASVLLVAAIARRNLRLATTALAGLAVLDARFYALLLRRGGPRMLAAGVPLAWAAQPGRRIPLLGTIAAGVPLHVLHRLTAVAAVPIALAEHVLEDRAGGGARRAARPEQRPRR